METYDAILERMVQSYAGYAGFTPPAESDILLRLRVLAGEVYRLQANEDYIERQLFPTTATGEYLERHAAERGLSRRPAATATGTVYFYAAEEVHPDILIPAGTEVCTYTDMRRFTTDSDVVLAENESRVLAAITAVEPGAAYNARGGTISIIVTPVPGVGRVYSGSVIVNGADKESDEALRARVLDSYVNIVSGGNAAYYKSIALSDPLVYSASVVGCGRGSGTVDVYISGRGCCVSSAVRNRVQQKMNEGRPLNVDVLVRDPSEVDISLYIVLTVTPGYVFSEVATQVETAVRGYIDGLGIGADVRLSKVGEVIYPVKGVAGFRFVESYGSNQTIGDTQYAAADSILVREA